MNRTWYAAVFTLAVVALTAGGIAAFQHLDALGRQAEQDLGNWPDDSVSAQRPFLPISADPVEYARFAAQDAEWRRRNARQYTLSELRARGDGRRNPQQALQDRVYQLTRQGKRGGAIAELERWVSQHPADEDALLWLARLLNESGRSTDAIARYRQALSARPASQ